jgi:hypothetical protein
MHVRNNGKRSSQAQTMDSEVTVRLQSVEEKSGYTGTTEWDYLKQGRSIDSSNVKHREA